MPVVNNPLTLTLALALTSGLILTINLIPSRSGQRALPVADVVDRPVGADHEEARRLHLPVLPDLDGLQARAELRTHERLLSALEFTFAAQATGLPTQMPTKFLLCEIPKAFSAVSPCTSKCMQAAHADE